MVEMSEKVMIAAGLRHTDDEILANDTFTEADDEPIEID
jgi:hypothetical protein